MKKTLNKSVLFGNNAAVFIRILAPILKNIAKTVIAVKAAWPPKSAALCIIYMPLKPVSKTSAYGILFAPAGYCAWIFALIKVFVWNRKNANG